MPDIGVGSILSAGASLVGGMMQADAASSAADAQGQATAGAIAENRRQYEQSRADLAPWRDTGSAAILRIGHLLGLRAQGAGGGTAAATSSSMPSRAQFTTTSPSWGKVGVDPYSGEALWGNTESAPVFDAAGYERAMNEYGARLAASQSAATSSTDEDFGSLNKRFTVGDFYADPVTELGLQFGLDEGRKGLERMAAARGRLNSGETLKALTKFGTDYTGTKAAESYNRFYADQDRIFNRLSGVSGTGQTASTNTASLGAQTAATVGGLMSALGNARGAAAIGGANAYGGALGNIGNYLGQQATLDKILASRNQYPGTSYTNMDTGYYGGSV